MVKNAVLTGMLCSLMFYSNAIEVDKNSWERAKEGLRYDGVRESEPANGRVEELEPIEDPQRGSVQTPDRNGSTPVPDKPAASEKEPKEDMELSKWIAIGIVTIIAIILIIIIIKQVNPSSSRRVGKYKPSSATELEDLEDNPEILEQNTLRALLQAALEQKDYRMAIRISFLLILEDLEKQNVIRWERSKTNREYLVEAKSQVNSNDFRAIISVYETVWFGKEDPNDQLVYSFQQVGQTLKRKGNG